MIKSFSMFSILIILSVSCGKDTRQAEKYIDNINNCYKYISGIHCDTVYDIGACNNFNVSIDSLEILTGLKSHITRGWVYAYMSRDAFIRDSIQYRMWLIRVSK